MKPSSLVRPSLRKLHAYVPGEQPKIKGLIKLNTNENPYPPAPKVLQAVRAAVDGRLRLYPNPTAQPLREALAKLHGCAPENIIIGNGSDELLALATRAFVEPAASLKNQQPPTTGNARVNVSKATVQYFAPSYSLYPVLTDIHGAIRNAVPLGSDFAVPSPPELRKSGHWDFRAALTFLTTPNAPSGRGYSTRELDTLCAAQKGVLVLDEAYVDFAEEHALELALKHPHVLVSRTFSKAYSLCFQRIGYFIGHPELIAALDKIRDSYNVNGLGQVAALTTLKSLPYYRRNFAQVKATRAWLTDQLAALGFETLPSQTNFILTRPPRLSAKAWLEKLREQKLIVRWFNYPVIRDRIRITIGTPAEAGALVRAVRRLLNG
ncbi:MAG TPA: aminotransferase class I/II-fold pyridoxal phosphate-dependent enzyme [Verrucomicrobiae bacterium]|nr:aminotransferase class I/II-fold pyridoxal phosphate-dependent enzyme [Verrucomicrobiae bacterium]